MSALAPSVRGGPTFSLVWRPVWTQQPLRSTAQSLSVGIAGVALGLAIWTRQR